METKKLTATQEKRAKLREISNQAQAIREKMLHAANNDTEIQAINALKVNDLIIENIYKNEQNQEFSTFKGWIKKGFAVKKGEKAFLIWGRPSQKDKNGDTKKIMEEDGNGTFFPLSYIFSNAQVSPLKIKENA